MSEVTDGTHTPGFNINDPAPNEQRTQDYFYDGQIRRFLTQFARMFSNFQVNIGTEDIPTLVRIPIKYGDVSRNAASIIADNSNNSIPCAPQFSFYINSLTYDRKNLQEPFHVNKKVIRQRKWDDGTQTYAETQGNAFLVERHMPAPYILGLTLDFWSTNNDTKLQAIEQITWIFNPSLEIQSTDNYLDWTSLSTVEIDPQIKWTSRSVPAGTQGDDVIDITSINFTLPIWISPPARVSKGGIIHKIIANIYDDAGDMINAIQNDDILLGTRQKITPHGYQVLLMGDKLQLLRQSNPAHVYNKGLDPVPEQDSDVMWHPTIDEYGVLNEGISQIRLETEGEIGNNAKEILGLVSYTGNDGNLLQFDIDPDTLPFNTLTAVNAVINPLRSGPPESNTGTRYLITQDIGNSMDNSLAIAWAPNGNELVASANDIIEFDGTNWFVEWKATSDSIEFVTNLTTTIQYKWNLESWIKSYEGIYLPGEWSIVL